jgi:hypothetical protein
MSPGKDAVLTHLLVAAPGAIHQDIQQLYLRECPSRFIVFEMIAGDSDDGLRQIRRENIAAGAIDPKLESAEATPLPTPRLAPVTRAVGIGQL